jgi:hypothetical protein
VTVVTQRATDDFAQPELALAPYQKSFKKKVRRGKRQCSTTDLILGAK